jgi:flagellar basal-body rod protein FlgF
MEYGLYVSAAGADSQQQRMEVLSHNLANVDTPGFKEEMAILQARDSRAVRDHLVSPGTGTINDLGGGVSMAETVTNFQPGTLKQTGGKWDMAIHGEGFFVVDNGEEQLLTRAGDFHVDLFGRLLTQQGHSVLSSEGAPIVVNPNLPTRLHKDGWLQHSGGGEFMGLAKPQSLGDLARVGENLFRPLAPLQAVPLDQRRVESGFLEISDVRPARAMLELIETSRAYEANVKMIQHHDQATASLINRILRTR